MVKQYFLAELSSIAFERFMCVFLVLSQTLSRIKCSTCKAGSAHRDECALCSLSVPWSSFAYGISVLIVTKGRPQALQYSFLCLSLQDILKLERVMINKMNFLTEHTTFDWPRDSQEISLVVGMS